MHKLRLALRIWSSFLVSLVAVRRRTLAEVVEGLGAGAVAGRRYPPGVLGGAVSRALAALGVRPRCLYQALVLYRLLREQGDHPVLVIGLPPGATDERAHAWVEVDGADVGPPPGRMGHLELARFS